MMGWGMHLLMGTVATAPVLTHTTSGTPLTRFDVRVREPDGIWSRGSSYTVLAWGEMAAPCREQFQCGDGVLIEGNWLEVGRRLEAGGGQATLTLHACLLVHLERVEGYRNHLIVGRLGADPVSHLTPRGTPLTAFDVAVNERWGGSRERTAWFRVLTGGKLGETCATHLRKGRKVLVQGSRLSASSWIDGEGRPRTTMELRAEEVLFLDAPSVHKVAGNPAPRRAQVEATPLLNATRSHHEPREVPPPIR